MGGLAIKSSSKIKMSQAEELSKKIISELKNKLKLNACTLGSIGKKDMNDYIGDIDIAIPVKFSDMTCDKIYNFMVDNFDAKDMKLSKGFKLLSIGVPFDDDKVAQVDFMFVKSLDNAKFLYHSPDYRNKESKFKGASRTDLMRTIVSETPVPEKYDKETYFKNGDLKTWWQFSLSANGELEIKHKTLESKKDPEKAVKNPVTIKEDTILYETDPDKIVSIIFGEDCDRINDLNSFESEVKYLLSDKYKYADSEELITNIFKQFIKNWGDLPENEKAVSFIKNNGLDK